MYAERSIRRFHFLCRVVVLVVSVCLGLTLEQRVLGQTQAAPFELWEWIDPYPTHATINIVIHDGQRFIAAGTDYNLITSVDGESWRTLSRVDEMVATIYSPPDITSLAYQSGRYVAARSAPSTAFTYTSSDAVHWVTNSITLVPPILTANGHFLASSTSWVQSADGIKWSAANLPSRGKIATDGKIFGYLGTDHRLLLSVDAQTWIDSTPAHADWSSVATIQCAGNLWIAGGINGVLFTSNDGRIWERRESGLGAGQTILPNLGFSLGDRYFFRSSTRWFYSEGGANWQPAPTNPPVRIVSFASANGRIVGCGTNGFTAFSTNGFDWQQISREVSFPFRAIGLRDGFFAALEDKSTSQRTLFSTNLKDWVTNALPTSGRRVSVAVGNRAAVACGAGKLIDYTRDFQSWQTISNLAVSSLRFVTFEGGQFLVVGDAGSILTSPDGENWSIQASPTPKASLQSIARYRGQFFTIDASGVLYRSSDLTAWEPAATFAPWNKNGAISLASGDDKILVVCMEDTFVSGDGISWRHGSLSGSGWVNDVVWVNGFFLACSPSSTFRVSRDGMSWVRSKFTQDPCADAVVVDGRVWAASVRGSILRSGPILNLSATSSGISVYGDIGGSYNLEFRSTLLGDGPWTVSSSLTLSGNPTVIPWTQADSRENRFYRLRAVEGAPGR